MLKCANTNYKYCPRGSPFRANRAATQKQVCVPESTIDYCNMPFQQFSQLRKLSDLKSGDCIENGRGGVCADPMDIVPDAMVIREIPQSPLSRGRVKNGPRSAALMEPVRQLPLPLPPNDIPSVTIVQDVQDVQDVPDVRNAREIPQSPLSHDRGLNGHRSALSARSMVPVRRLPLPPTDELQVVVEPLPVTVPSVVARVRPRELSGSWPNVTSCVGDNCLRNTVVESLRSSSDSPLAPLTVGLPTARSGSMPVPDDNLTPFYTPYASSSPLSGIPTAAVSASSPIQYFSPTLAPTIGAFRSLVQPKKPNAPIAPISVPQSNRPVVADLLARRMVLANASSPLADSPLSDMEVPVRVRRPIVDRTDYLRLAMDRKSQVLRSPPVRRDVQPIALVDAPAAPVASVAPIASTSVPFNPIQLQQQRTVLRAAPVRQAPEPVQVTRFDEMLARVQKKRSSPKSPTDDSDWTGKRHSMKKRSGKRSMRHNVSKSKPKRSTK